MRIEFWQLKDSDISSFLCRVQVEDIKNYQEKDKLLKLFKKWNIVGQYFSSSCNHKCYIFQKSFNSRNEWKKYKNMFPYEMQEIDRNFKVKKTISKVSRKRENHCKLCGKLGHNSRTCLRTYLIAGKNDI